MNLKHLAVTTLALAAAVFAGSSNAATVNGTSTATVIAPITLTAATPLAFGSFAASTGGDVIVSTGGTRTESGAVVLSAVGPVSAARFDVAGTGAATYSISIPASTTLTGPGAALVLTTCSALVGDTTCTGANITSGTLVAGVQSFYVGGTLAIAASQGAGDYAGTFAVSVEYN